jgi:predicted nucleic acid-binding protein
VITYVDTSTLMKLLIDEVGTKEAGMIWDEPDFLVSARLGHVEARAALAAAERHGRITNDVFDNAVIGLEVLWSQLSVVEIDEDVMRLAGDLATAHALRGYDAVHLAAAHIVDADVFSSADRHLCAAASSDGFHIANPKPQCWIRGCCQATDGPTADGAVGLFRASVKRNDGRVGAPTDGLF